MKNFQFVVLSIKKINRDECHVLVLRPAKNLEVISYVQI